MRGESGGMARAAGNAGYGISIPGTLDGLREGLDLLGRWLKRHGVGREAENNARLVFEEIVTNIVRHGFDDRGEHKIDVVLSLSGDGLTLVFDDKGRPFDPLKAPKPPRSSSLDTAPIGGRGLLLVKHAAKGLAYERTEDGRNRLTVALALS